MSKEMKLIPELRFPEFEKDEEWEERHLGEIGDFIGGGTPSTSNQEYWNGDILWYTPTEVKNGVLNPSIRTITQEGLQNSSAKLLPIGAILITTRATIGDAAVTHKECTTNQGFQSLVVKESEHNQFWYYWIIHHKHELERRSSGSTFKEIGKTEIQIVPTLSPKKDEQQKIASCLSSLDELIAAHKDKLDALKDHKKGLLQNLFPQEGETVPKVRFPEFEEDGEWDTKTLDELGELVNGLTYSPKDVRNEGLLVLRSSNIQNGIIDFNDCVYVRSDIKGANLSRPKDILICVRNGSKRLIGKNAIIPENIPLATHGAFMTVFRASNPDFVFQLFQSDAYDRQVKADLGATINSINGKNFIKYEFAVPSNPQEQQKIASCLSALDELITAQAVKIEQLKQHKKGLMQGLFPKMTD